MEVTEDRIAAGRAAGIEGVGAAQADTARSIRAERTEPPGSSGIVGLSLDADTEGEGSRYEQRITESHVFFLHP